MSRSTLFVALSLAAVSGAASAQYATDRYRDNGPRWDTARVVSVDPILIPGEPQYRQQCWQEPVRYVTREEVPTYARGGGRYRSGGVGPSTGTVLGGIVGAAVGHQIGDGDGRRAATVAGALLGSAIAHDSYRNRGYDERGYGERGYTVERESVRYEQRCQTVEEGRSEDRVVGYTVSYDYNGHLYTTETPYHPGREIRVRVDVTPEG